MLQLLAGLPALLVGPHAASLLFFDSIHDMPRATLGREQVHTVHSSNLPVASDGGLSSSSLIWAVSLNLEQP